MIIRDRHEMIERLKRAIKQSKQDNAGDIFKLNRLLKTHVERVKILEDDLKNAIHVKNNVVQSAQKKFDDAEIARLRVTVAQWDLNEP